MSEPTLGQSGGQNRGCLVAALVVLGLVVAYMVYVYFQYKEMPWKWAGMVVDKLVEASGRPAAQQEGDRQRLHDLIQAARAGKLGDKGLDVLVKLFSPCQAYVGMLGPKGLMESHIRPSKLTDDEKAEAETQLRRYCVAVRDDLLNEEDHKKWSGSFPKDDELGEDRKMTEDQVRRVVAGLKEILKDKKFAEPVTPFDFGREYARLLAEAGARLGLPPEPAPATQPAATAPSK